MSWSTFLGGGAPSARIAAPRRGRRGWPHRDASPSPCDRRPRTLPRPPAWLLLLLPPHYSGHAEPRRSATWPMSNAAGCGANKSSPSRGAVVPDGARSPAPPGTWRPTVRWGRQGGGAGQRSRGRGRGNGFAARPPQPSCPAEYASVTAGRTPGVTDQDLRRSETWLVKRRRLAGVIRAVIVGPPPKAHRRGRGRGEHLARPWRGAGGAWWGGLVDM